MADSNAFEQFVNDDDGYLRWLTRNPGGYVVNSFQVPTSDYLKLHRASCHSINTGAENNWTTTGYIKTCSTDPAMLDVWAVGATGGGVSPCGTCKPEYRPKASSQRGEDAVRPPGPSPRPTPGPDIPTPPAGRRAVPTTISTGCPELDLAWATYASMILDRSQVLIPDTDDDLTWHAFLGHSIDMQGFRAAEFVGVDALTRKAPAFVPLKARGIGVPELASLWGVPEIRRHLMSGVEGVPLEATLGVLRAHGGRSARRSPMRSTTSPGVSSTGR